MLAANLLVAAERSICRRSGVESGEEDDADLGIFAGVGEGLDQLGDGVGREGVAAMGRLMVTLAMPRIFIKDVFEVADFSQFILR